jgi:ADP-ribosylation factor related protein 1
VRISACATVYWAMGYWLTRDAQTMLEKIKTMYNPTPGMPPEKIGPTVGQNSGSCSPPYLPPTDQPSHLAPHPCLHTAVAVVSLLSVVNDVWFRHPRLTRAVGKISLPSTTLHFFDLGGQRDIRSIWPKYYDECHAVVFVLDACDQARLSETWEVFGEFRAGPITPSPSLPSPRLPQSGHQAHARGRRV